MLSIQHYNRLFNIRKKTAFFFSSLTQKVLIPYKTSDHWLLFQVMIKWLILYKKQRKNWQNIAFPSYSVFCLFNRSCVAGAVLQTRLFLINWLSQSSFLLQLWSSIQATSWSWTGVTSLTLKVCFCIEASDLKTFLQIFPSFSATVSLLFLSFSGGWASWWRDCY